MKRKIFTLLPVAALVLLLLPPAILPRLFPPTGYRQTLKIPNWSFWMCVVLRITVKAIFPEPSTPFMEHGPT